jgi:hypothetical protein
VDPKAFFVGFWAKKTWFVFFDFLQSALAQVEPEPDPLQDLLQVA